MQAFQFALQYVYLHFIRQIALSKKIFLRALNSNSIYAEKKQVPLTDSVENSTLLD